MYKLVKSWALKHNIIRLSYNNSNVLLVKYINSENIQMKKPQHLTNNNKNFIFSIFSKYILFDIISKLPANKNLINLHRESILIFN